MRNSGNRKGYTIILFIILFFVGSCIVEEYKIDELKIDENEWQTKLTAPLFSGELQLKDLIDYGRIGEFPAGAESLTLKFSPDSFLTVPAQLLFEPFTFIEKFHFLITDDYELLEGRFKYIVTNGSSLPLNVKTDFYSNSRGSGDEITMLPPPFPQGEVDVGELTPVTTVYALELTPEMLGFVHNNSVALTSWFEGTSSVYVGDTVSAQAPIAIKIILSATAKEIRDE